MSGVTYSVGKIVTERDGQCVARATHPGSARQGEQIHHRKPRRMGGTKCSSTNQPANLIWLCRKCHDYIESNRTEARALGWILADFQVPALTQLRYLGKDALLDDAGKIRMVEPPSLPEPA